MKIIFDLNNLAVRHWCLPVIEAETENPNIQLWKYNIIDSIYGSMKKYNNVTDVILAVDSPHTWRKIYWPRYKESRKAKRDKSKIDWNVFHRELDNLLLEIKECLPFKVIKVENAEGDDVVAVLAMCGDDVVIVSNDEDYLQLSSEKVKIFNPSKNDYVKCDDIERFLQMKSLIGQPKDDIFNIKTPIDYPVGVRKPGFGEVSAKKVLAEGLETWLKREKLEERYTLNRNLIDFKRIPKTIKTRIINEYKRYKLADPSKIYSFFDKNQFRSYIDNFTHVEENLMKLY